MDKDALIRALQRKGYAVSWFADRQAAADYLDRSIDGKRVGFGDSQTLLQLGLHQRLAQHNQVFDPADEFRGAGDFFAVARETIDTEVFLSSVNAMSEDGELVNIDRCGNRVAGTLYGHAQVYIVAGTNKVAPTLEQAVWRARNIAAPQNARRRHAKTPCAVRADRCYDCQSPGRLCNELIIHLSKPFGFAMEVVLIDEALGL